MLNTAPQSHPAFGCYREDNRLVIKERKAVGGRSVAIVICTQTCSYAMYERLFIHTQNK